MRTGDGFNDATPYIASRPCSIGCGYVIGREENWYEYPAPGQYAHQLCIANQIDAEMRQERPKAA